jgi:hypothetical protein
MGQCIALVKLEINKKKHSSWGFNKNFKNIASPYIGTELGKGFRGAPGRP